jgi:hypothetical protein
MSPVRLSDFRRSVAEAMKAFGQPRAEPRGDRSQASPWHRSEAAVREQLYGKRGRRP